MLLPTYLGEHTLPNFDFSNLNGETVHYNNKGNTFTVTFDYTD